MTRSKNSSAPRSKPSNIRMEGDSSPFNLAIIYGLIGLMGGIDYLQEVIERWQDPTASSQQRFVLAIEAAILIPLTIFSILVGGLLLYFGMIVQSYKS